MSLQISLYWLILTIYLAGNFPAIAHASASYHSQNGTITVPAVTVDGASEVYQATLQPTGEISTFPYVGQKFAIASLDFGKSSGIHQAVYHTANNLVYLPDMLITTESGTFSYRMLLQFDPSNRQLTVMAITQNGAALYDPKNGELHLPVVDSARGILSMDVLLDLADGKTGMFQVGSEFIVLAVTDTTQGNLKNIYDFNTSSGYFSEVLVSENGQTASYQVRFVLIPHQTGEIARIRVIHLQNNIIPTPTPSSHAILSGHGAPNRQMGTMGDFYIDITTSTFYGPKTEEGWSHSVNLVGAAGQNGKTILNGHGAPTAEIGTEGDFYIDTSHYFIYAKTQNGWGNGINLKGSEGSSGMAGAPGVNGTNGADGKTILNGTGSPAAELGTEGDFYIDTAIYTLHGPKKADSWGIGFSLLAPTPASPEPAKTILNGSSIPAAELGTDGDFYIDTVSYRIYGPKQNNSWGNGVSLIAPAAENNSILNGNGAPTTTLGKTGDFYLDTTSYKLYGPKNTTGWGLSVNLIGVQGAQGLPGSPGATGSQGIQGVAGTQGIAGQGVPAGGTAGQFLAKNSGTDYDTHWVNLGTFTDLTVTGNTTLGDAASDTVTINGIFKFEGATINGNSTALTLVDPTANQIITLPNASGSVVLEPSSNCSNGQVLTSNGSGNWNCAANGGAVTSANITDGEIVNADISATAAIVDTKLATLSTAGKVANTATTATAANTADAIVTRDASGNFSANAITANLTGNVTGNASTATELLTNGGNCSAGQYPLGVDAAGNVEGCTAASGGSVTSVSGTAPISVANGTTTPAISLSTVPVANGGTGVTTLTSGGFLVGNGTSAVTTTTSGANLTNLNANYLSSGTVPTAQMPAFTGDVTSSAGSTAATVTAIQGKTVSTTAPTDGQILAYNNTTSKWEPKTGALALAANGSNCSVAGQYATGVDSAGNAEGCTTIEAWGLTGNSGTTAGTNFIGTTDNQNLIFKANNFKVLSISAPTSATNPPNIIGGFSGNSITTGEGSVIGGGGNSASPNQITAPYGTIGGGLKNLVSDANGDGYGTVGGGYQNSATNKYAVVSGGLRNTASGSHSTVVGGNDNMASGNNSIVLGGRYNTASANNSLAAGNQANATDSGSFVFSDSSGSSFNSLAANEFAVRATGGVRFVRSTTNTVTIPDQNGTAVVSPTTCSAGQVLTGNGSGAWTCTTPASALTITYVKDSSAAANTSYAACAGSAKPIGGGCERISATGSLMTTCPGTSSGCSTTPTGWYCYSSDATLTAYVICLQ